MAYLFDTDAISELLRPQPLSRYVDWVKTVPRENQYASAVTAGELYHGAFRSRAEQRHLKNIEERVIPSITILPYDLAIAKIFGSVRARLEAVGQRLPDADLQIAATAIHHDLELVTGNVRHFSRISDLRLCLALHDARLSR